MISHYRTRMAVRQKRALEIFQHGVSPMFKEGLTGIAANRPRLQWLRGEQNRHDVLGVAYFAYSSGPRNLLMRLQHDIHQELVQHGGEYPRTLPMRSSATHAHRSRRRTYEFIQSLVSLLLGSHSSFRHRRYRTRRRDAEQFRHEQGSGCTAGRNKGRNTCDHGQRPIRSRLFDRPARGSLAVSQ